MPSPFEFLLLGLAAWRIWHLLAEDGIFDRPRDRLFPEGTYWREELIGCPYCLGFHVSLVVYLFWIWLPTETLYAVLPFSLNAVVIGIHRALN